MENKKEKILTALRKKYAPHHVAEEGNRIRIGQVFIDWPEARIKAKTYEEN